MVAGMVGRMACRTVAGSIDRAVGVPVDRTVTGPVNRPVAGRIDRIQGRRHRSGLRSGHNIVIGQPVTGSANRITGSANRITGSANRIIGSASRVIGSHIAMELAMERINVTLRMGKMRKSFGVARFAVIGFAMCVAALCGTAANAQNVEQGAGLSAGLFGGSPPLQIESKAKFAYVTDFATGRVLYENNPDGQMKPASMAKIMTIYIVFERIATGYLSLDETILISEKAWRMGGSKTFVEVGKRVTVRDLLYGIVIQSGNDAAVALAEGISGSEEAFVDEMNFVARRLNLTGTMFTNSTGWPHRDQNTTARDLNLLSAALIRDFPPDRFPELYPIFAIPNFTYNDIKQGNRNPLIYGTEGADGLKTGHTRESGYGLVGSAERNGQRIIMVLNGMSSMKERSTESRRLMDLMFREFKLYKLFENGQRVDRANVWLGDRAKIDLVLGEPLHLLLSRVERKRMKVRVEWLDPIPAPIREGQVVGKLLIDLPLASFRRDLVAGESVAELGVFDRVGAAIKYLLFGESSDVLQQN